jgi:type II secretion system protein C
MQAWIEKHFYLVNLAVIGLTSGLVGLVVTNYASSELVAEQHKVRKAPKRPGRLRRAMARKAKKSKKETLRKSQRDVTRRNVFCSYCKPEKPTKVSDKGEGDDKESTLSMDDAELLATLVTEGDDDWCFATIRFKSSGQTRVVAKGSKIEDAEITRVEAKRVTFQKGEQTGTIELLPNGKSKKVKKPRPSARRRKRRGRKGPRSKWRKAVSQGVKKVGKNKYEIDRSLVQQFIANANVASKDAKIYPHSKNGKADGYRLGRVRPRGIFAKLGLRSGDVVNSINNVPITSPDKLLTLYTKLPTANHMTIGITRHGKPVSIDYSIK